ncbi:MAG TPA: hypothetical protein DCK83_00570 [Gallionellaceae bacterium]|nr:hypothetical protein [Gallionellaceae bacterium]
MSKILCAIIAATLIACTAVPGSRPNRYNYPPSYLQAFPLNISEAEAIAKLGPPDQTINSSGKKMLVYRPNLKASMSYSVIVENGNVVDVIYNESGSLNGITATEEQRKAASSK